MPLRTTGTTVRTLDGLRLDGTLVTPDGLPERGVVFVHGGGVTREEAGFFTRLAIGLGEAGVASLRYDLRGHGQSDGLMQETTLSAHLNDIRVALAQLREVRAIEEELRHLRNVVSSIEGMADAHTRRVPLWSRWFSRR
jgi:alpha-beta hydrolase superfamily lysophospholipase